MTDYVVGQDARVGQTLSHYRIIEKIGAGGMGEVYRAHDQRLDREVAVKLLPSRSLSDEQSRKRFHREALTLSKLNHPNIATIYDFDTQQGVDFLVMEYIPGVTLNERLTKGPTPEKEVFRLGVQLAEGLAAAHEHGVVHRDLKPGNLRLTSDGRLKILDFGLAKLRLPVTAGAVTESITETQGLAGTLPYMAPEQLLGREVDARTDIHAAGSVLYEMATGQTPFADVERPQLIGAILQRCPVPPTALNPNLPLELERIIGKCLEKDPENRYQSARELAVDLRRMTMSASSAPSAPVRQPRTSRTRKTAAVALCLVVFLVAGFLFFRSQRAHALTPADTIVLADFANSTGDPVFDDTLKQALTVQLEQSPFLNILSDRKVALALRQMRHSPDQPVTTEIAREVCQRVNSRAMLSGSIANLGNQYVLGLKATNCASGDLLAVEQARADGKEQVLKALDAAASSLRRKLGESLASLQEYDTPLEQASTSSLAALRAYSTGIKELRSKGEGAPIPFLKRAVELDPQFAVAYSRLGNSYYNLGEIGLAAENTRKAYELRQRVSERERLYIESFYYHYVTGELEKAATAYELLQHTYPHDQSAYANLGSVYTSLGRHEDVLAEEKEALRLDLNNGINYLNLGNAYLNLDRVQEAEAVYRQSEERKLESEALIASRYQVAFLNNDVTAMQGLAASAIGKPGTEDLLLALQADTEAWNGRLKSAWQFTQRAIESAEHNQAKETAAAYQIEGALREAEFGYAKKARADAGAALRIVTNRDVGAMAALALARAGDTVRAEKMGTDLSKAFPLDTLVQSYWLPSIRAAIELQHKSPDKAVAALRNTLPYDLGVPTQTTTAVLYPAYLRGEAYLMLRDGNAAVVEFRKLVDHRGIVANFPLGALARIGLARAYTLQGDSALARAGYLDFFTLRKDADPGIPILKQAKAEYAKVQ